MYGKYGLLIYDFIKNHKNTINLIPGEFNVWPMKMHLNTMNVTMTMFDRCTKENENIYIKICKKDPHTTIISYIMYLRYNGIVVVSNDKLKMSLILRHSDINAFLSSNNILFFDELEYLISEHNPNDDWSMFNLFVDSCKNNKIPYN